MAVDTNKLPFANTNFRNIRNDGKVYVDKTRMIYQLASSDAPIFLSRPRRFGKSLLVSTFESLFTRGLEDFKGLEIEKLWKEDKTYPVISLNCSGMLGRHYEEIIQGFEEDLRVAGKRAGFIPDETSTLSLIGQFEDWLKAIQEENKRIVLLIDEYDAPLTHLLNNTQLFEDVRSYLAKFYAKIKRNNGAFRFIFITGIAKFQKASIFSIMNDLKDITLNPNYGTITGYTQEELEKYFGPYLDNATEVLNISRAELLARMEEQYDGFCFDEAARYRLYAPWSVLSFLTEPGNGFKNYWSKSGGSPTLFLDYYAKHSMKSPEEFTEERSVTKLELEDPVTIDKINPLVLLTQAGYYTIDHEIANKFYLRYPNGEVRETMAQRYAQVLYKRDQAQLDKLEIIVKAIDNANAEEIYKACNTVILNFPSGEGLALTDEAMVRGFLMFIFLSQGIQVIPEKPNALGRADLVATHKDQCVVFEFKYCYDGDGHPKESADALLKEAVKQMIEKKYGLEIIGKKVLRMAMVFSEKERSFVRWQKVELDATL